MSGHQKTQLVQTIAGGLVQAERKVQEQMNDYLSRADANYGLGVRAAMEALN